MPHAAGSIAVNVTHILHPRRLPTIQTVYNDSVVIMEEPFEEKKSVAPGRFGALNGDWNSERGPNKHLWKVADIGRRFQFFGSGHCGSTSRWQLLSQRRLEPNIDQWNFHAARSAWGDGKLS